MPAELKGKIAVVTGSARNIGRAIALALGGEGATVVVNARTALTEAQAVVKDIERHGGSGTVILGDVSKPRDVERLFAEIKTRFGRVDILVNNAAPRPDTPLECISYDEWRHVLATVLDGSFLCAQAAVALMPDRGRIINIGGLSAHTGAKNRAHVVSAKAGLVGLTKALAVELAPRQITANLVAPGRIATDRTASGLAAPTHFEGVVSPLGFRGAPEDVGELVRHLAGPRGGYITGQVFHVSGGLYLP